MKRLALLLAFAALALTAGQVWRYDSDRDLMADRLVFWGPAGNTFERRISKTVKTVAGENTLELTMKETAPEAAAHTKQVNYLYQEAVKPGTRFRLTFAYRGTVPGEISCTAAQATAPFKSLAAGAGKTLAVTTEWQEATLEFTVTEAFAPPLAMPRLMPGKYPAGGVLYIGPVRLEEVERITSFAPKAEWLLCRDAAAGPQAIPAKSETVTLKDEAFDLSPDKKIPARSSAWFYQTFELEEAGTLQIGMAADWWFECYVNGKKVYETKEGNLSNRFRPEDHIFNFKANKGSNLLAVKVLAGSGGWKFVCGKVGYVENPGESRIVKITAGAGYRPLDMTKMLIQKGTALDFSELTGKRLPAGSLGRVIVNPEGKLAFEQRPAEPVRFLSFNFAINYWRLNAHTWTKADMERFADAVANQGYNLVRVHFLDRYLLGWKVHYRPHRNMAEAGLPLTADKIEFDPANLDRWEYLVKCFKERGIYLNIDLMSASSGYSMAYRVEPGAGVKGQLFFNPEYREHWRAAVQYVLTHVNPYTKTALKDEPTVACINFLNEQDLLMGSKELMAKFTTPFRNWLQKKYGPGVAGPFEIDEAMLRKGDARAEDAGTFLQETMTEMTGWFLAQVREIGYPGLYNHWDMIMRTLEIPVRATLPAIAQHSYFAHPNPAPTRKLVPKSDSAVYSGGREIDTVVDQNSSLKSSYFRAAAMARFLDRPYLITEYSHASFNRYRHERGLYFGSYAALQGWDCLTAHADTVRISFDPFFTFESAMDPISRASETVAALTWLREDVREAPHTVGLRLDPKRLFPANYLAAIGDDYAKLALLTKTGILYGPGGPRLDWTISPNEFSRLEVRQWYVSADHRDGKSFGPLVSELHKRGILPAGNRTDPAKRLFESETGELFLDGQKETMTVVTPRLEGVILKGNTSLKLNALEVRALDRPMSIVAASLEKGKSLREAKRVLLTVATNAFNTNMSFENDSYQKCLDAGELPVLVESAKLELQLETAQTSVPAVYALHLDGTRSEKLPAEFSNGQLRLRLDTSKLKFGTPYFEIVY